MAGQIPDLNASVRTGTGKGAARQSRRDGNVPGIVFGGDTDPLPINIPFNKLLQLLKAGRFKSTLFNLKVDGHDDAGPYTHLRAHETVLDPVCRLLPEKKNQSSSCKQNMITRQTIRHTHLLYP